MKNKLKTQAMLLTLVFCISLIGVPFVYGAIPKSNDVETGAKLIESKIDFLIASLEEDPNIIISEKFKENSHIYKWINHAIKNSDVPIYHEVLKAGQLHESGDPLQANIQLDKTIRKLLELVRVHEDLDAGTLDVIDALIALLDASAEAYSPSGAITSVAGENKGAGRDRSEVQAGGQVQTFSEDPEAQGFRFYGKEYDLDDPDQVIVDPQGAIVFDPDGMNPEGDEEKLAPFITPFYQIYQGGDFGGYDVSGGDFVSVELANETYRKYSWNVSNGEATAAVSATLFEDPDNSPIVLDYYNEPDVITEFPGGALWGGIAGIFPGQGDVSLGYPSGGEDLNSDGQSTLGHLVYYPAFSPELPVQYHLPETDAANIPYTPITNGLSELLLDSFFVLMPDRWDIANDRGPVYSVTFGTRNLLVDMDSVYESIDNVVDDVALTASVVAGDYCPGTFNEAGTWQTVYDSEGNVVSNTYTYWDGYQYGLQTVGQPDVDDPTSSPDLYIADFAWFGGDVSLDMLNDDGLLAYMVQVEEDRVNRKILELANNATEISARSSVLAAQTGSEMRGLDAAFVEMADAQSGKVLKDIHGNWVRVQQYILRPDNTTVQFLNVSLRGGDGPLAGFSTMDFTTNFANSGGYGIEQDLRELPWHEWLSTQSGDSRHVLNSHEYVRLDNMSVEFVNPGEESLTESRIFNPNLSSGDMQLIDSEQLVLSTGGSSETFDYVSTVPGEGQYTIGSDGPGTGFYYDLGGVSSNLNMNFYMVGDVDDSLNGAYSGVVKDIWDALAVNESGLHPNIGNSNNLEIVIDPTNPDGNYFNNPIDVVYVPMSRMLWKDKDVIGSEDI